jgi:hypothetical protein
VSAPPISSEEVRWLFTILVTVAGSIAIPAAVRSRNATQRRFTNLETMTADGLTKIREENKDREKRIMEHVDSLATGAQRSEQHIWKRIEEMRKSGDGFREEVLKTMATKNDIEVLKADLKQHMDIVARNVASSSSRSQT